MNRTVPAVRSYRALRYGVLALFVIVMMLFCSIGAAARSVETPFGTADIYAQINPKKTDEIQIVFVPDEALLKEKQGETLYLFTLHPNETADVLSSKSPTATKVIEKTTKFTVTLDTLGERLRAKYLLALGEGASYRVLGEAYVINPDVLAENTTPRTEASTMKGLVVSGALAAEAQSLGIGQAVIPIVADRYITAAAGDPQYSCATEGQATHFDPTMIAQLDALVASLQKNGTHIMFRFLLDGSDRGTTEPASAMYAVSAFDSASAYGFTMETKTAYQTVNNLFTFFAQRYAKNGQAPIDFIIGYQVNEWVNWYNLGYSADQLDKTVRTYTAVVRLADLALRSQSANSRVYVPLSNLWATGRPFLSAFAAEMGADRAWSVAVSPYASNALDDGIWDDQGAENSRYSTYLTMNNIGVLKDFLEEEPYLYQNTRRSVIIDDFAVHGTSGDDASQERQAASFVYAYYTASGAEFIDAFIWHRIMDGAGEQCSLGLRQLDAEEKPIYELFREIDTQRGSKAAEQYAKIVGERKWSSIIKGFSKNQAETTKLFTAVGESSDLETVRENALLLLDFTDRNLRGFVPSDYMASVEVLTVTGGTMINSSVLSAVTHLMAPGQIASISAPMSDLVLPQTAEMMYVTLKADASAQVKPTADGEPITAPIVPKTVAVQLYLSRDGEQDVRFLGEAEVTVGAWIALAFDIKDYARAASGIDGLRLALVGGAGDPDITYTLSVNDISYETGAGLIVLRVFLWILAGLLLLVLIFAVLVIRAQIIRRRRRRQRAAQRAAYLARQRQLQAQQRAQQMQTHSSARTPAQSQQPAQNPPRREVQRRPDMYRNNRR